GGGGGAGGGLRHVGSLGAGGAQPPQPQPQPPQRAHRSAAAAAGGDGGVERGRGDHAPLAGRQAALGRPRPRRARRRAFGRRVAALLDRGSRRGAAARVGGVSASRPAARRGLLPLAGCAAPSRGPAAPSRARARPLGRRASPGSRHRPLRLVRPRARGRRVARAARALLPARARAVAWRRLVPECFLLRPRRGGHRSALRGRRRRGAHLFSAGSRGARPPQVWRRVLHLHGAHRAGAEGARARVRETPANRHLFREGSLLALAPPPTPHPSSPRAPNPR
ncbi:hypothetical protein EMIHUDRAFT_447232, partial [Emiliania huxleyi CCMP1516]|uniref:Uncharacterized protein n=2 Tax=Emiliania huxleyi TaxID=2903 RepID=A0A0D3JDJ8_EMIH1